MVVRNFAPHPSYRQSCRASVTTCQQALQPACRKGGLLAGADGSVAGQGRLRAMIRVLVQVREHAGGVVQDVQKPCDAQCIKRTLSAGISAPANAHSA